MNDAGHPKHVIFKTYTQKRDLTLKGTRGAHKVQHILKRTLIKQRPNIERRGTHKARHFQNVHSEERPNVERDAGHTKYNILKRTLRRDLMLKGTRDTQNTTFQKEHSERDL